MCLLQGIPKPNAKVVLVAFLAKAASRFLHHRNKLIVIYAPILQRKIETNSSELHAHYDCIMRA